MWMWTCMFCGGFSSRTLKIPRSQFINEMKHAIVLRCKKINTKKNLPFTFWTYPTYGLLHNLVSKSKTLAVVSMSHTIFELTRVWLSIQMCLNSYSGFVPLLRLMTWLLHLSFGRKRKKIPFHISNTCQHMDKGPYYNLCPPMSVNILFLPQLTIWQLSFTLSLLYFLFFSAYVICHEK